jgi:tetratricopeptide (TPR) repeat protein
VNRLALARSQARLATNKIDAAKTENFSFYFGSIAVIALPLLGLVVLSPATRARLHLMRGNYGAAVQIYEKILVRNPDKVKIYPALANLYLLQGRYDENAMKIYKMVLQLNLAAANRDEINAVVAQKYLTEGRTDSDAIEVLESALQAEQRRSSVK